MRVAGAVPGQGGVRPAGEVFDPACRRCPRLAAWLDSAREKHPGYHLAPVPAFGDAAPRLLIVGLAPGFHGANRTGRPFTGDHAGILLYRTLHALGLASAPGSNDAGDGLCLHGVRITNAVRCVPPANAPRTDEVHRCNAYLTHELESLSPRAVLALGQVAHRALLRAIGARPSRFDFAHAAVHDLSPDFMLVDSYHCSRYNTQTRRLTDDMFHAAMSRAAALAGLIPGDGDAD
ncbi:MAG TPA: SPO1 DNA polymerase [Gammaproteobacteria bacterium]|nr:SPO1 DNA polymerase [Gammaproteobacteria bacterium]